MRKPPPKSLFGKILHLPRTLYRQFITRDIDITRNEFLSISSLFSAVIVLVITLVDSIWGSFSPAIITGENEDIIYIIAIITLVITGFGGGILIDFQKSKISWAFGILGLSAIALFCLNTDVGNLGAYVFGVVLICFSILFLFLELITILLAKTSIMERARVTAGVLIFVGIATVVTLGFTQVLELFNYSFVLFFIFFSLAAVFARKVKWRSDSEKFNGRITREFRKLGILQYTTLFFGLSFLLGVSIDALKVDYAFMGVMMIPWALLSAILLDNMGRKGTIIATVLLLAIYVVFSGSTFHYSTSILSGVFGMVLIGLGILIVVLSGDLASPGIRSRVLSVNGMSLVGGFLIGFVIRNEIFSDLSPENLLILNDTTSFVLILCVLFLVPLKDTLANRDISYRDRILQIYVNNYNGINLFARDITEKATLSEDLVSGGLTGIAAMVGEITQGADKPSIIDNGDRIIMLEYGRRVVIALVVKKGLYVLRQKMRSFIKDFEETFALELQKDSGNVTQYATTKNIIQKYFKID